MGGGGVWLLGLEECEASGKSSKGGKRLLEIGWVRARGTGHGAPHQASRAGECAHSSSAGSSGGRGQDVLFSVSVSGSLPPKTPSE